MQKHSTDCAIKPAPLSTVTNRLDRRVLLHVTYRTFVIYIYIVCYEDTEGYSLLVTFAGQSSYQL